VPGTAGRIDVEAPWLVVGKLHLEALAYMQFAAVSGLSIANSQVFAVLLACSVWFAFIYLAYQVRTTELRRQQSALHADCSRPARGEEK
jgi:hypothetical protein